MNALPAGNLRRAVEALWQAGKLIPDNLYAAPAFIELRKVCKADYPRAGSDQRINSALGTAIYNLGFRWAADAPSQRAVPADITADRIDSAFRATRAHRIHLCPLDQADEIPPRHFGPNSVRSFTADELNNLVEPHGVMRRFPDLRFDSDRFAQFSWLVVEESVDLPGEPNARSLPSPFPPIIADYERIEPHLSSYPQAVEAALFALLTAPWEDIVGHSALEWRPFRVPWIYTIDDDLFARSPVTPSANSLMWEPAFYENELGETIEYERPFQRWLERNADEETKFLNDDAWEQLVLASESPLFAGPVKHFLVRAFVGDGIDEFLAHVLVIEAALGLMVDHDAGRRPRLPCKPDNPGATARVGARLGNLLNDRNTGELYKKLFDERSKFVHGRSMAPISGKSRLDARRLARQCVCALVGAAISDPRSSNRDEFLKGLLRPNRPTA